MKCDGCGKETEPFTLDIEPKALESDHPVYGWKNMMITEAMFSNDDFNDFCSLKCATKKLRELWLK